MWFEAPRTCWLTVPQVGSLARVPMAEIEGWAGLRSFLEAPQEGASPCLFQLLEAPCP